MAPMDDNCCLVERALKEFLIGLDLQTLRHVPLGIGEHAVRRDDSVGFD
jgi:hypothetical protein